jgi:hypothetical protein
MFATDYLKDPWLRLLGLLDHGNHWIKEGDWYEEDKRLFYDLKDQIMEKIHREPPRGAVVNVLRVPYLQRCTQCKDKAGGLMRSSGGKTGFEYYLNQIPPCPDDVEIPERASLEMEVVYFGRLFCFHVPVDKMREWSIDVASLRTKDWIPARDFHHSQFKVLAEEIRLLTQLV